MNRLFLCILTLCCSCAGIKSIEGKRAQNLNNDQKRQLVSKVTSVVLYPGKVSYVEFPILLQDGRWTLSCSDKNVPFFVKANIGKVYLSESYFSEQKEFKCYMGADLKETSELVLNISIKDFDYKSERLYVDKRRVILSKEDQLRVKKEREITNKVYANTASYYLFEGPFQAPLNSYITSHYGTRRIFNNEKKSSHLGNDFRAAVGVPIPVSNRGRVVFTGNLFYSGNAVIVDHGMDIFTLYGHLSKILVTEGTVVNQGDILGLSGRTGRVSGPHLHWGVRLNGNAVDGFSLIQASKQQFQQNLRRTSFNEE